MSHPTQPLETLILEDKWSEALDIIQSHPKNVQLWNKCDLPIHLACSRQDVPLKVISALIAAYPQSVKLTNRDKMCLLPLHFAVVQNSSTMADVVSVLLKAYKKGAEIKDIYGDRPLTYHLSFYNKPSLEIVKMLVGAYPDDVQECDGYNKYPLHHAARCGNWEILLFFIHLYPYALLKKDKWNRTPRDICNMNGHEKLSHRLLEEEEMLFGKKRRSK